MKPLGISIIVAGCLVGALATAYGLGLFGNGSPVKEIQATTVHSQSPISPGSSGRVTMIDVGATECIPCKMMAPIMAELEKEYEGIADIIFIDIWKNPAEGRKYGVQTIPTQIFFDSGGNEVFRHVGFLDKKPIVDILTRMGATRPAPELSAGSPTKEG
jgi:thioredoxin 1